MDDDVDDDACGSGQSTPQGTASVLFKRKRVEPPTLPMNVDVTKLGGKSLKDPPINNQNRFSILADLEIENDNAATMAANRINANNLTKSDNKPKRSTYCPPIFLYNVNIKHLVDQLEARTPKITFKIKNVNRSKSKLYLADTAVHSEMMALLKEKKVNSYSFTPKELRQTSLIIRGLYCGMEADDIKVALDRLVPNVIDKVSKYTTVYSLKNNKDTGLFLTTLLPGKGLADVSQIKYLLSQTIIWEKPKKKDQEIQCRRCQLWGHVARNCNREVKCVKCDKSHEPGKCGRLENDGTKPWCVNCKQNGHPASWRGCDSYKKYVASRKARINEAREKHLMAANNVDKIFQTPRVSQGVSFASLFQKPSPQQSNKKSPIIEQFLKLANLFMEAEELTLEQEIQNFLGKYRTMTKDGAKAEFLRLLNKVKNSYDP